MREAVASDLAVANLKYSLYYRFGAISPFEVMVCAALMQASATERSGDPLQERVI